MESEVWGGGEVTWPRPQGWKVAGLGIEHGRLFLLREPLLVSFVSFISLRECCCVV